MRPGFTSSDLPSFVMVGEAEEMLHKTRHFSKSISSSLKSTHFGENNSCWSLSRFLYHFLPSNCCLAFVCRRFVSQCISLTKYNMRGGLEATTWHIFQPGNRSSIIVRKLIPCLTQFGIILYNCLEVVVRLHIPA